MKTIIKTIAVSTAVLACCWEAAVVPGAKPAKAYGLACWYDRAYYVKYNCTAVFEDEYGRIVQLCCD